MYRYYGGEHRKVARAQQLHKILSVPIQRIDMHAQLAAAAAAVMVRLEERVMSLDNASAALTGGSCRDG
jgi:hypothetical protein